MSQSRIYDVIIIGGGPAGLTAAIFASRGGLSTLLISEEIGGLMLRTEEIENYPGFLKVDPQELADRMKDQAERFGAKATKMHVNEVKRVGGVIEVSTETEKFRGRSLIIATGLKHRKLGVAGEDLPGVSYCAVCDGPLYKDMDVFVVGSGDSAISDALFLSKISKSVNVIVRREEPKLRATEYLRKKAFASQNIKFIWHSVVDRILGEKAVEGIRVRDLKTGELKDFCADAIFIQSGFIPRTGFLEGFVDLTEEKFVKVINEKTLETSQEGVFVAGDVRDKLQRQIATAVGDGALVVESVIRYLQEQDYIDKILGSEKIAVIGFRDSSIPNPNQYALLEGLKKGLGQRVETVVIDRHKRNMMAERFRIKEVPTILIVKKKEILTKVQGEIDLDGLTKKVGTFLNDPKEIDPFRDKEGWIGVNEDNHKAEVLESEKPVVVEFWGPKCKDCLEIAPAIYEISEEYMGKVKFCHFKCPSRFAVVELRVRNLPTFYFYEKGRMIKSLSKEDAKPEKVKETLEALVKEVK